MLLCYRCALQKKLKSMGKCPMGFDWLKEKVRSEEVAIHSQTFAVRQKARCTLTVS
jgi:hypothetical protein